MKIVIERTDKIVTLVLGRGGSEVPARVWEGITDRGVPCLVYVTRVGVKEGLPASDYKTFETELSKQNKPMSDEVRGIPLRLIV